MKPKIIQPAPPSEPLAAEVIATEIQKISKAMEAIQNSKLKRRAIVALIQDQSKLPKRTIEIVLNNLEELEKDWCKPAAS